MKAVVDGNWFYLQFSPVFVPFATERLEGQMRFFKAASGKIYKVGIPCSLVMEKEFTQKYDEETDTLTVHFGPHGSGPVVSDVFNDGKIIADYAKGQAIIYDGGQVVDHVQGKLIGLEFLDAKSELTFIE